MSVDLLMDNEGDLVFDPQTADLVLATDVEQLAQRISYVLRTRPGTDRLRPTVGCRTHELAGKANTSQTGQLVQNYVADALVSSGVATRSQFTVDVYPIGAGVIRVALVFRRPSAQPLRVTYNMDVNQGSFDRIGAVQD